MSTLHAAATRHGAASRAAGRLAARPESTKILPLAASRVCNRSGRQHGPPNRMKRVARPGIRRCDTNSRPADRTRGWFHSVWRPMQAQVPKGAGGARGAENDKKSVPVPGRCSQEQTCSRGSGGHQAPTDTHHKRRTRPHMHRVNRSRARWPRLDMLSWQLCGARCLRGAGAVLENGFGPFWTVLDRFG